MTKCRSECTCSCHNGQGQIMHVAACCVPDPVVTPKPQYFVLRENSLGYVSPLQPHLFCVLASGIGGPDWRNGPIPVDWEHMRMATLADFDRYRVDAKGHIEPDAAPKKALMHSSIRSVAGGWRCLICDQLFEDRVAASGICSGPKSNATGKSAT